MNVRSPTATLDEGWDTLLPQRPVARAVEPLPEYAEILSDIIYFHEQGLDADAEAMLEDLRRRYPDEPALVVAPWDCDPEPATEQQQPEPEQPEPAAEQPQDEWVPDERDILEALDMLDEYDTESAKLCVVEEAPAQAQPASSEEASDFHDVITVVECPTQPPVTPTGTLTYPVRFLPQAAPAETILVGLDEDRLAAAWFEDALEQLKALEDESPTQRPRYDECDVDLAGEVGGDWDMDEVEIDTAEFTAPAPAPAPAVVQTLTYLPRDLEEMRRRAATGSVHDTMPYSEEDKPRAFMLIPGGG